MMPFRFLAQLRASYPQFAEQGRTGAYSQEDAEECWSQLLYTLRERLRARPDPAPAPRGLAACEREAVSALQRGALSPAGIYAARARAGVSPSLECCNRPRPACGR